MAASCRLETTALTVERRSTASDKIDHWNLALAIAAAIQGYDAADPKRYSKTTLADDVIELLRPKPSGFVEVPKHG